MAAIEPVCILSNSWEMAFQSTAPPPPPHSRLPLVFSGGCASAGVVEGDPRSHTTQGCPVLLGPVAACPGVLVVSGARVSAVV